MVDHWVELVQRAALPPAGGVNRPRRRVFEMVPADSARAECGGQVVLNVAYFSISPAHQAW